MRITCPHCGERDLREFSYKGHALALNRPLEDAGQEEWDDYLHNRDNIAGDIEELWQHLPCGTWIVAERNTVTHVIAGTRSAKGQSS